MIPKTLQQAIRLFSDEMVCIQTVAGLRWPDGKPACPKCSNSEHYWLDTQKRWKCKACGKQFSVKVGTIFEDSALPLSAWLPAMWLLTNCKNGISSYELAKDLGITQKSAWFMLHRIRKAMQLTSGVSMMGSPEGGEVEADETWVGPKPNRMHRSRRIKFTQERSVFTNSDPDRPRYVGKTPVQGLLDRDSKRVVARTVRNTTRAALQDEILANVAPGSRLYTDEHSAYWHFDGRYVHQIVNHMQSYVDGRVHTNGMENFWSLLKRGLRGTYVAVEPFHLDSYLDEQVFRYNNRATKDNPLNDADRFALAVSQVEGRRLTYKQLTGKEGESAAV